MTWYCTTYGTPLSLTGIAGSQLGSAYVCYQTVAITPPTTTIIMDFGGLANTLSIGNRTFPRRTRSRPTPPTRPPTPPTSSHQWDRRPQHISAGLLCQSLQFPTHHPPQHPTTLDNAHKKRTAIRAPTTPLAPPTLQSTEDHLATRLTDSRLWPTDQADPTHHFISPVGSAPSGQSGLQIIPPGHDSSFAVHACAQVESPLPKWGHPQQTLPSGGHRLGILHLRQ